jgi:hypothetical protein
MAGIRGVANSRFGRLLTPIALAVVLGLCSLPVVLLGMPALDPGDSSLTADAPRLPPLAPAVVPAAITSVLAAAIVTGALWGGYVRRHPVGGSVGAIVTAWAIGVAALPLGPRAIHEQFIAGFWCIDGCAPLIHDADPESSLKMFIVLPLTPLGAPGIFAVLAIGIVVWTWVLGGPWGFPAWRRAPPMDPDDSDHRPPSV